MLRSKSEPLRGARALLKTAEARGPRVRMYRVGFGDFFLITLPTGNASHHILIDCGVHAGDIQSIRDAVTNMAEETGQHLSLVVATHRHADHISGFATCAEQFREFAVDMVWMSWWDDPTNQTARKYQANLQAIAATAQIHLGLRAATDIAARQGLAMMGNITGDLFATGTSTGGGRLAGNDAALAMLRGVPQSADYRFKSEPARRYYKAGDKPELPADLEAVGLTVEVLGPPIDENLVAQMNNAAEQYLSLVGERPEVSRLRPFGDDRQVSASDYPQRAFDPYVPRELPRLLRSVLPDSALQVARKADNTINNQSLVLHFTFAGRSLLFVGDAQWGDWANFLYGDAAVGRSSLQIRPDSANLLAGADFYKVGHHGSTNATPIDAIKALRDGCAAMCSTQPDCYGQESKGSEVPRVPLLDALQKKTKNRLVRSDQIAAGRDEPTAGLPKDLPPNFSTPGRLFVDCQL